MGTSIKVDESASFRCTGCGYGKLEIVWRRVKHSMPLTVKITKNISGNNITSTLKFTKTAGHYSGQYYCVVKNKVGKAISQIANLSIQGNIKTRILSSNLYQVIVRYYFIAIDKNSCYNQLVHCSFLLYNKLANYRG